jgi:pimeloyl-ACP methyl ester carboxylesterase
MGTKDVTLLLPQNKRCDAHPLELNFQLLQCQNRIGDCAPPLLVFVHGIAGSTASWGVAFRQLSDHAHVLLLDCLGFGDSPKPDIEYSPHNHVTALQDTLQKVMDTIDVSHIVLIGHSMGALLVADWYSVELSAIDWPNGEVQAPRFAQEQLGAVLISMPVYRDENDAMQHVGATSLFNKWMALETPLARATCWLMCHTRPWLMTLMPGFLPELPPQVARDSLKHTWRSYSESLRKVVLQSNAQYLLNTLNRRSNNWLVVHGEHDTLAPSANMHEALANSWKSVGRTPQQVWLSGAHDIIFTHAQDVAQAIEAYVKKQ